MHFFLSMRQKIVGALMIAPWLAACSSIAPGMHFNVSSATSGSPFGAVNPDVKPVVKTITPQLVKLEKAQREKQTTQDISNLVAGPKPYHIQGGDILSIVVWDHPELSTGAAAMPQQGTVGADTPPGGMPPPAGFVVSHEGTIQFPYAGPLKVAGLTEAQARSLLASKLAKYIRHPNVTLRVQSYRSKRVYVDGEVKTPGLQPITDIPMTLMEALNRAGGLLPSADQSRVSITREGQTYNINLMQLTQRGVNPARIMLANGDVVRVMSREDNKIFVSGEVMQPKSLPMHNGRLTLNEALGDAGGINPQTGDGRQVYVIRNATEKEPIVYHLDARSPAGLAMAEEFELRPKDVVYVDAAPLATWHRVISLILPGALTQAVQTGKN